MKHQKLKHTRSVISAKPARSKGMPSDSSVNSTTFSALENLDKEDLLKMVKTMINGGIVVNFHGKRTAQEIDKKVRPRQTRVIKEFCVGSPEVQARNMIIEGENLQAMVTLYKERGQVDLILTDPPYNTGQYFRYNDRWDTDPNDPELGQLVKLDDGSRHTKWMKAMLPRLNMMKAMLKPTGVLAICIDHNELFHLGMMLDEIFGEENRIAIINWQKSAAARPDNKHVSTSTEYVLVYSNDIERAKTSSLERTKGDNKRYGNPDNDPEGEWREGNLTAKSYSAKDDYGIQSPFTGTIHYPAGNGAWRHPKKNILKWLEQWGSKYEERDLKDGRVKALVLHTSKQGTLFPKTASDKANKRLEKDNWPFLWFGSDGTGRPRVKTYLNRIKRGKVPVTYWSEDDFSSSFLPPAELDATSWNYSESGRSADGVQELNAIMGTTHGFTTVKPLKLMKKIIQLWCPPNGLVLDPYAGSGTTGHAVLELNRATGSNLRFILVEQGEPEKGDKYARSLTQERLKRVISGTRPDTKGKLKKSATPLAGGFHFRMLTQKIDSKTVLTMRKDELIDLVITSHWENNRRGGSGLIRIEDNSYKYLVGKNEQQEGYFLIWNGGNQVGQLDVGSYSTVIQEGKKAGLKQPYHVYARYEIYQSKNIIFYKIPDKILAHLGLSENSDRYNEDEE